MKWKQLSSGELTILRWQNQTAESLLSSAKTVISFTAKTQFSEEINENIFLYIDDIDIY